MNSSLYSLTDWLRSQPATSFPKLASISYANRLNTVEEFLNSTVHPEVEKAALANNAGYLNNHGIAHIQTVIERAGRLLSHPSEKYPQFSAYEIHLLVLAIHFHDVGNFFGRQQHEENAKRIMDEMSNIVAEEAVERKAILSIARAHGGTYNGSKDTISSLPTSDHVLGFDVRFQPLAAILRFADELADDFYRASRLAQKLGQIPERSEIYHAYSRSLQSLKIDPSQGLVDLKFNFNVEDATRTFGKQVGTADNGSPITKHVFLLDEIFERTLKMYLESKYCMRFMSPFTRVDGITVRVEVFEDENSITPAIDPIGYRLSESGYPSTDSALFSQMCPDVRYDGGSLQSELQGRQDDV
ncbi:HD domain-containing protein [Aeoliella sp.]|uniref:HD domain-containing protein n=1 Tax=Aeoliella sp. TaxID=2795800 RepID=UPI003CCBC840